MLVVSICSQKIKEYVARGNSKSSFFPFKEETIDSVCDLISVNCSGLSFVFISFNRVQCTRSWYQPIKSKNGDTTIK